MRIGVAVLIAVMGSSPAALAQIGIRWGRIKFYHQPKQWTARSKRNASFSRNRAAASADNRSQHTVAAEPGHRASH